MSEKKKSKGSQKSFASKRTINPPGDGHHQQPTGQTGDAAGQQHDEKGRQGSFETAGEHARTGSPGHQ
jgi:hypothetical protein